MTIARAFVQTAIWLAIMAALLFGAAGDVGWPQAWVFLGLMAFVSVVLVAWLHSRDPALLASRFSSPFQKDQKPWDRLFLGGFMLAFFGWLILMGLDARRFGWSRVPVGLQVLGGVLLLACFALTWRTFRANSFAAPQVRMQGTAHRVISDGPYRHVRHPMYSGALLYFVGLPLLLGSWWGLALAPVLTVGIGARAIGEEAMLGRELDGYAEYMQRVRYRLVPGIW